MGYLSLPHGPKVTGVSDVKASKESHALVPRRKRNILFPSGVKLCAQESAQQVAANHLSYFNLRGKTGPQPGPFEFPCQYWDGVRLGSVRSS